MLQLGYLFSVVTILCCTVDVPYQSYGEEDIMKLKEIVAETHTVEIAKKKKMPCKKSIARKKNSSAILRHAQNVLLDRNQK